ncbi:SCO4848 family membrane protein [Kitasatospora sp. NBC_01266]|uniref:SCO4848 family membrane protein n=1 Tax=Kitasatospora sp. NBC_01266 TaxID=2903572 RepID=UPI003FA56A08
MLLSVFHSLTFVKNLWQDSAHQAFTNGDHSHPTAFFWIHLALAITSFALGVLVGLVGLRGLRSARPVA